MIIKIINFKRLIDDLMKIDIKGIYFFSLYLTNLSSIKVSF